MTAPDLEVGDEPPALTPDIADDDEALGALVDLVIDADPVARARAMEIAQHVDWLRCSVDSETWKHVLEIESRQNERWADLAVVLIRRGFAAGRQFPLRSPEDGGSP